MASGLVFRVWGLVLGVWVWCLRVLHLVLESVVVGLGFGFWGVGLALDGFGFALWGWRCCAEGLGLNLVLKVFGLRVLGLTLGFV